MLKVAPMHKITPYESHKQVIWFFEKVLNTGRKEYLIKPKANMRWIIGEWVKE